MDDLGAPRRQRGPKRAGSGLRRLYDGYLWSSYGLYEAAAGAQSIAVGNRTMFATAAGGSGSNFSGTFIPATMTDLLTNLKTAGALPKEIGFRARDLGFHVFGIVEVIPARAVWKIVHGGHLWLTAGTWDINLGPAYLWPGGGEEGGFATTAAVEIAGGGTGIARRRFKTPLLFPPGSSVSVDYRVPTAYSITAAEKGDGNSTGDAIITVSMWGEFVARV